MESHVSEAAAPGTLYVVSTPIGNMGIFLRAVDVLRSVNGILAEDTRHTRGCSRATINTPMAAYHEHNEAKTTPGLVARLSAGESFALVSDAGTPLLSDPGARLVAASVAPASRSFRFPARRRFSRRLSRLESTRIGSRFSIPYTVGGERRLVLDEIASSRHTVVLYEAPNRLADTLGELEQRGSGIAGRRGAK
jgi:16S rRNA (cytidine1402-2'-O)-methyltransferase